MKKLLVLLFCLTCFAPFVFGQTPTASQLKLLNQYQSQSTLQKAPPAGLKSYFNKKSEVDSSTDSNIQQQLGIKLSMPYYLKVQDPSDDILNKIVKYQNILNINLQPEELEPNVFGYDFFGPARNRILKLEENIINGLTTLPSMSEIDANSTFVGPIEMLSSSIFANVPNKYYLKIGDKLNISFWSKISPLEETVVQISNSGMVRIPSIGNINAIGQTLEQFQDNLNNLVKIKIGKSAQLTVGLQSLSSIQLSITGEVFRPGSYLVNFSSSVFNALYACGGINKNGSFRNIKLIRNGKMIPIDFYDLLLRGEGSGDVTLQPGDILFVPPYENVVTIKGEVKRYGKFEMLPNETLEDLLELAGGIKATGIYDKVLIESIENHVQKTITLLNLKKEPSKINTKLNHGDKVTIFRIEDKYNNQIVLEGAVKSPGIFQLKDKMRLLDLVEEAGGFQEDTFFERADIYSFDSDFRTVKLNSVDLQKALEKDPKHNVLLENLDKVVIYSKWNFELEKDHVVSVFGAVQKPGIYPRPEGITLKQVLFQSGRPEVDFYEKIVLIRTEKNQMKTFEIDYHRLMSGEEKDIVLQDMDYIVVKSDKEYLKSPKTVYVDGEIKYPGVYAIKQGSRYLSEVLEKAGGVLDTGWLPGVVIQRNFPEIDERNQLNNIGRVNSVVNYINKIKYEQSKLKHEYLLKESDKNIYDPSLAQAASLSGNNQAALGSTLGVAITGSAQQAVSSTFDAGRDTGAILTEARSLTEMELYSDKRVITYIPKDGINGDSDVLLENNDIIYIPRKINVVQIIGSIYKPSRIAYNDSNSLEEYINMAGGLTEDADDENIIILRANGALIPADAIDEFHPGDIIYVPTKIITTEIKTPLDKILDVVKFTIMTLTSYWVLITLLSI